MDAVGRVDSVLPERRVMALRPAAHARPSAMERSAVRMIVVVSVEPAPMEEHVRREANVSVNPSACRSSCCCSRIAASKIATPWGFLARQEGMAQGNASRPVSPTVRGKSVVPMDAEGRAGRARTMGRVRTMVSASAFPSAFPSQSSSCPIVWWRPVVRSA